MSDRDYVAIDPVALVLTGRALDIYYHIKHPHEPSIQEALRNVSLEERKATLARAKALVEQANEIQAAIEKVQAK